MSNETDRVPNLTLKTIYNWIVNCIGIFWYIFYHVLATSVQNHEMCIFLPSSDHCKHWLDKSLSYISSSILKITFLWALKLLNPLLQLFIEVRLLPFLKQSLLDVSAAPPPSLLSKSPPPSLRRSCNTFSSGAPASTLDPEAAPFSPCVQCQCKKEWVGKDFLNQIPNSFAQKHNSEY